MQQPMANMDPPANEIRLQGIGVAPGIAHGIVQLVAEEDDEPQVYRIPESGIDSEISRLKAALLATREQIVEMQRRIAGAIGAKDAGIFDAHVLVVEDQTLIDEVIKMLREQRFNVEYTFHKVAMRYARSIGDIDDPYLRERALDIQDVTRRVIRNLTGSSLRKHEHMEQPHILVAHDITPSDTATMNRELVLGFATDGGSKTSHTAIMAGSLNLPAVVGLHSITYKVRTGDQILLDGYNGLVIIKPSEQTLAEYNQIASKKDELERRLGQLREAPAVTTDGRQITLSANIETPGELPAVIASGAEGVGLYRTEFLLMNRSTVPDEETQYRVYRKIVSGLAPHTVIIRTLDVGGDKFAASLDSGLDEANPFLGWRAIRLCLERPEVFKPQLRAMLRAGVHGRAMGMFPMISSLDEVHQANALVAECAEELRQQGIEFAEDMKFGIMIEVPSAAMIADKIAPHVEFFSIGTNDLIQYTTAVDRLNDKISALYSPAHPGVLRLIRQVSDAAHAHGKWVGVCGEMAGDPLFVPLLIGLDIDELSVGSILVSRIKSVIRSLEHEYCRDLAARCLELASTGEVIQLCRELANERYPELV